LGDILGLDGADAEAFDGGFFQDAAEEVEELYAGGEVAAVGAEVDAAEDDFAEAGIAEAPDFLKNGLGREAAAFSADEGDDAVGAARIAAILDLQGGASVVPFPAQDGSGKKFGPGEDIAGEDVAEQGRSMLRPYKGAERNGRVRTQCGYREKIGCGFVGRGGRERID